MPRYHYAGGNRLRDFYTIDIEIENDSKIAYFLSRWHKNKRKQVGPAYSTAFTDEEILLDIVPYIERGGWGDVFYCPHCGR